jgi:FKBP-type peptidyl-prolyl cis-trans isomerase SlpA
MMIQATSYITINYRLSIPPLANSDTTTDHVIFDSFADKPITLSLGQGQWPSVMEEALYGLVESEELHHLSVDKPFGEHNAEMVQRVSLKLLKQQLPLAKITDYNIGDVIQFPTPEHIYKQTNQGTYAGEVIGIEANHETPHLIVDFNHPLADKTVNLTVQVISVL